MELQKAKKGAIGTNMITNLILLVIMIVMLFSVLAETSGDLGDASDNLTNGDANDTLPFISFFKKKGILYLALMGGIVIALVKVMMSFGGGGK